MTTPYHMGFLDDIKAVHFGSTGIYYALWHMAGTRVTGTVTPQMLGDSTLLKRVVTNEVPTPYGPDAFDNSQFGGNAFNAALLVKCSPNDGTTPVFGVGVNTSPADVTLRAKVISFSAPDLSAVDGFGNHWWQIDFEVFVPVFDEQISINPLYQPTIANGGLLPVSLNYRDSVGSLQIWDTASAATYTIRNTGNFWIGLSGYVTSTGVTTMACSPPTLFDGTYTQTITETPFGSVITPSVVPYFSDHFEKGRLVTMNCSIYAASQFPPGVIPTLDHNGSITPSPSGDVVFFWSMQTQVGDDIATFNDTCNVFLKTRNPPASKAQVAYAAFIGDAKPLVISWPSGSSDNYFPIGLGAPLPFGTKPSEPYPYWPAP